MKTPFSTEQFFGVFEKYNTSVFPFQIIILLVGIIALLLVHSKRRISHKFISGFLGFLWLWSGTVFSMSFFSSITKAALAFGTLYILQAIFFIVELFRRRLVYSFTGGTRSYLGYFFVLFGLIIYPVISYLLEGSFAKTITLGLPCPTTILTFGFLMLTSARFPKYLLIIPTLWAVIGTGAAVNLGIYQDYLMLASAIVADIYLLKRKKGQ